MDIDNRTPASVLELEQMGAALAREMAETLKGRTICTPVILHALITLHLFHVRSMPVDAQREIGFAMASYAGELISAPYANPQHEPHQFPTDLPTALQ